MTQQTETTRYRFNAKILGKEVRGKKTGVKLNWKLPGSKFELILYLDPDDAAPLDVGDELNWSITRANLGKDKDGSLQTGEYPHHFFWDWDKEDSAARRVSPTVFEDEFPEGTPDEAERSMNEDFSPTQTQPGILGFSEEEILAAKDASFTGKPEPQGRAERPNAPVVEQDKYQLSAARRDAMVLIEMGVWGIPEGRNPLSWVRECSSRMFYFHHSRPMEPQYWCYEHNKGRNDGSNGYGHPVEGGSCVWEKGIIMDDNG